MKKGASEKSLNDFSDAPTARLSSVKATSPSCFLFRPVISASIVAKG